MTRDAPAAIRARHLKNMLEAIERLPQRPRDVVLPRLAAADLRAVRDAASTAWLDVAVVLRFDDAIATGGDDSFVERFFHDFALVDYASAYLQPFVRAAVELFGPSPGSFVRWVPRGWPTIFRGAGELVADGISAHEALLVHTDLPPAMVGSRSWLRGHRAYFSGLFDLAKTPGTVSVDEHDVATGRLALRFRW